MFGVSPDLTTLGKITGGGLPIGAFCGRREIMQMVAPQCRLPGRHLLGKPPFACCRDRDRPLAA